MDCKLFKGDSLLRGLGLDTEMGRIMLLSLLLGDSLLLDTGEKLCGIPGGLSMRPPDAVTCGMAPGRGMKWRWSKPAFE